MKSRITSLAVGDQYLWKAVDYDGVFLGYFFTWREALEAVQNVTIVAVRLPRAYDTSTMRGTEKFWIVKQLPSTGKSVTLSRCDSDGHIYQRVQINSRDIVNVARILLSYADEEIP